jgi:hypothetical protein
MFLAVFAVFVGCVLAILGMTELSDAWLDGVVEERPSLAINLSLAFVNIAVLTTFGVFGYAVHARSVYLVYKAEVEAGAPHDASQPWRGPKPLEVSAKNGRKAKSSAWAAFNGPCLLLAQVFTVTSLALCITMLLVLAAAVFASVSADYGCDEAAEVLAWPSLIPAALAAVDAAADAPRLELASALCDSLVTVESINAPDSCFKLDIAFGIINTLLSQWPLRMTHFEPLVDRLSDACASFSSATANANDDVCTPLLGGNATAIASALAAAGSSMTVDQYVTSAVDFSPGRLRFLALRASALLSNADETVSEVAALGRDTCATMRDVHRPLERLLIASAIMLLSAVISRACFVRYARFIGSLAARDGPHWAPADAVIATLLLCAGMMLGASALGWAAQAYDSDMAAAGAEPSIAPTVAAAVCACVFCILVALLVVCYGAGTRRLLGQQSQQTKRSGSSFACGRMLLQLLVPCVWLLTVALVLVSCLSLGAALGGRLVGRYAVEGSDLMHTQLVRPPTRLVNESGEAARPLYDALVPLANASLADPAPNASGLNLTQLCFVYSDLAETEAPVRRSCVLATFATRVAVRLANAPPFSSGINGSEYAMDCGRLPAALAAGRTGCADAPRGTPNHAGALVDERELLSDFLSAYRHLLIFNRLVGDASQYVYVSLDALVGPFVRLLIASLVLVAGTALLSSAFSRYTMMEFVFFTKVALAAGQRRAAAAGSPDKDAKEAASRRQSRRESRRSKARAVGDAKGSGEPQA